MRKLSLFFLIGLILSGCASSGSRIISVRDEYTEAPAVIFIPGYYGSALVDEKNERRFLTFQQFFGDRFSLALFQDELKTPESATLRVEGVIGSINAVPFVKDYDGYGSTIDFLQSDLDEDVQVFPFAYDWRQDLQIHVRALDELIDKIHAAGAKQISIVAHSLGGLITAHYLRYGTEEPSKATETWVGARKIDRVVFAGVPWRGTMSAFRNMQIGAPLYWNKFLLSQDAVSSFPSTYFLLPYPDSNLIDRYGAKIPNMINDPWLWTTYDWGLLRDADLLSSEYRKAREAFTKQWLTQARLWLDQIHAPTTSTPPRLPILNIVGVGRETFSHAYWIAEDRKLLFRDWDIENFDRSISVQDTFSDGDETITKKSATLPTVWKKSFSADEIETSNAHGNLFNAGDVKKKIRDFLKTSLVP